MDVIADSTLKSSAYVANADSKIRCMLAMTNRAFARLTPEVFITAYSAEVFWLT